VVFSCRIRPDSRAALEKAAKAAKRSFSQQLEHLIRESAREERTLDAEFGGPRSYGLWKLCATAALTLRNIEGPRLPRREFLDDPYVYDQVVRSTNVILEMFRPADPLPSAEAAQADDPADPVVGLTSAPGLGGAQGRATALDIIREAQSIDPTQDPSKRSRLDWTLLRLREHFDDIDRVEPYGLTAKQEQQLRELGDQIAPLLRKRALANEQGPDGQPRSAPLTTEEASTLEQLLDRRDRIVETRKERKRT
jgi:hypothetical protein